MIQLLADENVHSEIITRLKGGGFDIISAVDVGLVGEKDYIVLEYSLKENRVILTGDKDFGGLLEFGLLYGKGKVILLRYTIMDIDRITSEIITLLKQKKKIIEECQNILIVLSEGRYRIHHP